MRVFAMPTTVAGRPAPGKLPFPWHPMTAKLAVDYHGMRKQAVKRLPALLQNSSVGNLKPALGYSAYIL